MTPIVPPVAKSLPEFCTEMASNSSDSPGLGLDSIDPSAYDFLISQNVIFLSWPTLKYLLLSLGLIEKQFIPPILNV